MTSSRTLLVDVDQDIEVSMTLKWLLTEVHISLFFMFSITGVAVLEVDGVTCATHTFTPLTAATPFLQT